MHIVNWKTAVVCVVRGVSPLLETSPSTSHIDHSQSRKRLGQGHPLDRETSVDNGVLACRLADEPVEQANVRAHENGPPTRLARY